MKRKLSISGLAAVMLCAFSEVQAVEVNRHTESAGTRTINFPVLGGAPIGQYVLEDEHEPFMDQWQTPKKLTLAKGPARFPVNARVTLSTGWQPEHGLQFLSWLKPNDLFGLDVIASQVTHNNLKHICALKGLRKLVINGRTIDDTDVARLAAELPNLEELYVIGPIRNMTDRSVASIAAMKNLRVLQMASNELMTDRAVAKLSGSKSLTSLYVGYNPISDASLSTISKIQTLKTLDLSGTKVTDNGLRQLLSMPALRRLDLTKTAVNDKSMQLIGQMVPLEFLNLNNTQITDKGINSLDKLVNLRKLWLREVKKVTNASIPQLVRHSKLENLELAKSGINTSGIKTLGRLLPKTEVHGKFACRCNKKERVNW